MLKNPFICVTKSKSFLFLPFFSHHHFTFLSFRFAVATATQSSSPSLPPPSSSSSMALPSFAVKCLYARNMYLVHFLLLLLLFFFILSYFSARFHSALFLILLSSRCTARCMYERVRALDACSTFVVNSLNTPYLINIKFA